MKLLDLLTENSDSTYDYGCAMLYGRCPDLFKIQDAIDPRHIYIEEGDKTYGLEDEPHITLLYGLHNTVRDEHVKSILESFKFPRTIRLHNISYFENPKYDVLKFDVDNKNLHEVNKILKKLPFTSDYPDYHPHTTLGYLKKGTSKHYKFKNINDLSFIPEHCVYSKPDGNKLKFKIQFG